MIDSFAAFLVAWRRLSDDTFLTIGRVTWVQDSNLVLEHLRKGKGVTSWDLIFRQARLDQAGDYECQVTSQDKHVRTVTLTVIDEPTFNSQLIVPTGQLIRLECNMSTLNQSKFDLHWYKNGRKVKADTYPYYIVTRYEVQSTQMYVTDLIIENASLDDSGIYTCRSSRQIIDTTKVTVIRSDPSNSKREETREDLIPKPVEDMRDSMFGENILPDDTHSFFSTDRLPSKSSDGKSGSAGLHYRHRGLCWLTPCLPAALLWGFLLLLRHLHLPLCVIRLPAS